MSSGCLPQTLRTFSVRDFSDSSRLKNRGEMMGLVSQQTPKGHPACHHSHLSHSPLSWPLVSKFVYWEMTAWDVLNFSFKQKGVIRGGGVYGFICLPPCFRNSTMSQESGTIPWSDVATYWSLILHFYFVSLHLGKELFAKVETDLTYHLLCPILPQFRDRWMLLLFSAKPWGPPNKPFSGSSKGCGVHQGHRLHSCTTGDRTTVV